MYGIEGLRLDDEGRWVDGFARLVIEQNVAHDVASFVGVFAVRVSVATVGLVASGWLLFTRCELSRRAPPSSPHRLDPTLLEFPPTQIYAHPKKGTCPIGVADAHV